METKETRVCKKCEAETLHLVYEARKIITKRRTISTCIITCQVCDRKSIEDREIENDYVQQWV
jgi:hypothetical protein